MLRYCSGGGPEAPRWVALGQPLGSRWVWLAVSRAPLRLPRNPRLYKQRKLDRYLERIAIARESVAPQRHWRMITQSAALRLRRLGAFDKVGECKSETNPPVAAC